MVIITLPSGTVVGNGQELPLILIGKVLKSNVENPHSQMYPYYFTIMYANGVSMPLVYEDIESANLDRNIFVHSMKPNKENVN